jgi:hypothetical protein
MRTYLAAAFAISLGASSLIAGSTALAQDIEVRREADAKVQVSPEVWAYLQELQRQDDPKYNVRRAAMAKAEQRRMRLASQQWYGYSNSRPVVNPMPFTGNYSPAWSGNPYNDTYWYPSYYYPSTAFIEPSISFMR